MDMCVGGMCATLQVLHMRTLPKWAKMPCELPHTLLSLCMSRPVMS